MQEWDAIGIGLAVRDVSVLLDRYPGPDEKIRAREIHESGGGPVPTALVTLARFGRRTALSALVGDDDVGRFILDGLRRERVDVTAVGHRTSFVSPTSVILVENGRRTILEAPHGVDFPLEWDDVKKLPLEDASALLVDARVTELQLRAAGTVREAGGFVVLDCGHPRDGVEELLGSTDVAIVSHTYPRALYGEDHGVEDFLAELLEKLPRNGLAIAGMTDGAAGCWFVSPEQPLFHVPGESIAALDTTGAGDVFHGAFVHAFLKTRSLPEAARFANQAAAAKCTAMTGRAPLPPEEDLWKQSSD